MSANDLPARGSRPVADARPAVDRLGTLRWGLHCDVGGVATRDHLPDDTAAASALLADLGRVAEESAQIIGLLLEHRSQIAGDVDELAKARRAFTVAQRALTAAGRPEQPGG